MSFYYVIAIVAAILAVGVAGLSRHIWRSHDEVVLALLPRAIPIRQARTAATGTILGLLLVIVLALLVAPTSFTVDDTMTGAAIVRSGEIVSVVPNGNYYGLDKWSTDGVVPFSLGVRNDDFAQQYNGRNQGLQCIYLQTTYGDQLCIQVNVTWNIATSDPGGDLSQSSAQVVYGEYRTLDSVQLRNKVIRPQLQLAIDQAMYTYDPLSPMRPDLRELSVEINSLMYAVLDDQSLRFYAVVHDVILLDDPATILAHARQEIRMGRSASFEQCLYDLNTWAMNHPGAPLDFWCTVYGQQGIEP